MPLLIISGLPSSGKTYRSEQLRDELQARITAQASTTVPPFTTRGPPLRVHLISDHTLGIRRAVYDLNHKSAGHERTANAGEKDARAAIYGAVKRALSPRDIVILDGPNYIKGWRYQLYCEARALSTPCCVMHVGTPVERARSVNEARWSAERVRRRGKSSRGEDACDNGEGHVEDGSGGERRGEEAPKDTTSHHSSRVDEDNDVTPDPADSEPAHAEEEEFEVEDDAAKEAPYKRACWENLVFRYEEPNAMTRWDRPLFTVVWDDPGPPTDAIWTAMFGGPAPDPSQATSGLFADMAPPTAAAAALSLASPDSSRGPASSVLSSAAPPSSFSSTTTKTTRRKITPLQSAPLVRPHQATVLQPGSETGYLHELDRATQDVVARVLRWTRDHPDEAAGFAPGGATDLDLGDGLVVEIDGGGSEGGGPVVVLGPPVLQRLRRQFIALNRRAQIPIPRLRGAFVDYLGVQLGGGM